MATTMEEAISRLETADYYYDICENLEKYVNSLIKKSEEGINFLKTHRMSNPRHEYVASVYSSVFQRIHEQLLKLEEDILITSDSLDSNKPINTQKIDKKLETIQSVLTKLEETLTKSHIQGFEHYKETQQV